MSDRPWNPVDDGILPIAKALEFLVAHHASEIRKRLEYWETCPSGQLGNALTGSPPEAVWLGAHRKEILRRWLQTSGYGADANEFSHRVKSLLAGLLKWERHAR